MDDLDLHVERRGRVALEALRSRLVVEPACEPPPDLAVVGQVVVPPAVALPACSFSSMYESTGIRGSASWAVTTSQNAFSVAAAALSK